MRYDDAELDPVRRRILELLPDSQTNMRQASIAIGRDPAYMYQFIHRGTPRILAERDREALAEHLRCRPEELRHDLLPPRRAPSRERKTGQRAAPKGFVVVPEIDVRAATGPGGWKEEPEQTKEPWLLPDPLIRHELRARPEGLRMITVDGDAAEPLLSSGDRILIDATQQVPVPPGVFVIWDGMGLVAKRIEHVPHSESPMVVIRSVNPEYASYERLVEEVRVVGRAVWVGRRLWGTPRQVGNQRFPG